VYEFIFISIYYIKYHVLYKISNIFESTEHSHIDAIYAPIIASF